QFLRNLKPGIADAAELRFQILVTAYAIDGDLAVDRVDSEPLVLQGSQRTRGDELGDRRARFGATAPVVPGDRPIPGIPLKAKLVVLVPNRVPDQGLDLPGGHVVVVDEPSPATAQQPLPVSHRVFGERYGLVVLRTPCPQLPPQLLVCRAHFGDDVVLAAEPG